MASILGLSNQITAASMIKDPEAFDSKFSEVIDTCTANIDQTAALSLDTQKTLAACLTRYDRKANAYGSQYRRLGRLQQDKSMLEKIEKLGEKLLELRGKGLPSTAVQLGQFILGVSDYNKTPYSSNLSTDPYNLNRNGSIRCILATTGADSHLDAYAQQYVRDYKIRHMSTILTGIDPQKGIPPVEATYCTDRVQQAELEAFNSFACLAYSYQQPDFGRDRRIQLYNKAQKDPAVAQLADAFLVRHEKPKEFNVAVWRYVNPDLTNPEPKPAKSRLGGFIKDMGMVSRHLVDSVFYTDLLKKKIYRDLPELNFGK